MKKIWMSPAIDVLNIEKTAFNINQHEDRDGQYMEFLGQEAWECEHCS